MKLIQKRNTIGPSHLISHRVPQTPTRICSDMISLSYLIFLLLRKAIVLSCACRAMEIAFCCECVLLPHAFSHTHTGEAYLLMLSVCSVLCAHVHAHFVCTHAHTRAHLPPHAPTPFAAVACLWAHGWPHTVCPMPHEMVHQPLLFMTMWPMDICIAGLSRVPKHDTLAHHGTPSMMHPLFHSLCTVSR